MAFNRESVAVLVLIFLMALCGGCNGVVYTVGDSSGWTIMNYTQWAATKLFHVGDTIVFEYNSNNHNVVQVKHHQYQSCNSTSPIAFYSISGYDSITLKRLGHLYFICGVSGHCKAGQKVDIRIVQTSISPTSSPIPANAGLAPGPSKRNAASVPTSPVYFSMGSFVLVALIGYLF